MRAALLKIAAGLRLQAEGFEALAKCDLQTHGDSDPLVDRRTAGIAGRVWDRGRKSGGFPSFKDGRRWVARRSEVLKWLETQHAAQDAEVATYAAIGIRLAV